MRTAFVINLLFAIMIGNILHAAQEVESDPDIIKSFTDLKRRTKAIAKPKSLELIPENTIPKLKIPKNIQVSPEILDAYLRGRMSFQEELECVHCKYQTCNCNKKILAEYIQDHSFDSFKNLSDLLVVIFCLKELKALESNELRWQKLESEKFKRERELKQQLDEWIGRRGRDEFRANEREGYKGLIVLLLSAFFMGRMSYYVYGC